MVTLVGFVFVIIPHILIELSYQTTKQVPGYLIGSYIIGSFIYYVKSPSQILILQDFRPDGWKAGKENWSILQSRHALWPWIRLDKYIHPVSDRLEMRGHYWRSAGVRILHRGICLLHIDFRNVRKFFIAQLKATPPITSTYRNLTRSTKAWSSFTST